MNHEPPFYRLLALFFLLAVSTTALGTVLFSEIRGNRAAAVLSAIPETRPPEPALLAHAYIVRFAGEEKTLAERRSWKPLASASITKLMTASVAADLLPRMAHIGISAEARAALEPDEKLLRARAGETFARDDMLRLTLIESYNDAARALAEAGGRILGGTDYTEALSRFVAHMNERARDLGLANTHFANPSGMDETGHVSSAKDLAILLEHVAAGYPELLAMTRTPETVVISDTNNLYRLKNTNVLLAEFPGLEGGKTGFTDKAQESLAFLYRLPGGRVATAVILGSSDRFGDAREIINWLETNYR